MSTAFSFQEEPFEFDHEFEQEEETEFGQENFDSELDLELNELDMTLQKLEAEEEIGGRSRVSVRPPPPSLRPRPQPAGRRPPAYRPRPSRVIHRRPRSVFPHEPIACICPQRTCPQHGTEYIRWVQSALNGVLGLRLPVNGIMGPETRSAVRSFQEREGLPVTGIVGPDIESALIAARAGKSPGPEATKPAVPGISESGEPAAAPPESDSAKPAAEFDFEWETRTPLRRRPVVVGDGPSVCSCPEPSCPAHGMEHFAEAGDSAGEADGFQAQLLDEMFDLGFNEAFEDGTSMSENNLFEISKPKVSKRNRQGYIKWVQISLNKALGLKLVTDGKKGTQTSNAIRDFQKKLGLKADGMVDQKTEQALIKASYPLALNVSKIKSVRITPQKPKKVNAKRLIPRLSERSEVGIEIDPVNAITTIFNNEGDVKWELDQMKEAKHPWNQEKWGAGVWTSRWEDFYAGMSTVLGDEISAKFRINYKHNGHSVGYFHIENINTEDAAFWGLEVTAKIFPDPNAYDVNGKRPVAAVEVNFNYRFHHFYYNDQIYSGQIKFFGNGHVQSSGKWMQR